MLLKRSKNVLIKITNASIQFHIDFHSNLLNKLFLFILKTKINNYPWSTLLSIEHRDDVIKCSKLSGETAQLWLVVPLQF